MNWHRYAAAIVIGLAIGVSIPVHARTVKVGIVAPYTGGFASWGVQFRNCVQLFMEENGDSPGGHKVEVIYRDTGGANPALSKKLVEELIVNDNVDILGGFYFSPNAFAVSPVLNQAKKPGVLFLAGTPEITTTSPYWVRVGYTVWQVAVPMAQWANKQGMKRVYIAVADFAPGHSVQEAFKSTFTKLGGTIVGEDRMPLNTADYAPFVQRIADAKPDGLYMFVPNGPPAVAFVKAVAAAKLQDRGVKVMGIAETDDQDLPAIGPAAKGIYSAFYYTIALDTPANQKFVKAVTNRFGAEASPHAGCVGAYDGMKVIYQMIQKTNAVLDAKAIDAVRGMSFDSPRGPISIDPETRDIIQNVYIRVVDEKDGKLYNRVLETFPAVKDPWKELNKKK
ncbi:MAG: ABC transporter substrate-binding protein [Burkholderiales bacterium]